MTNLWVLRPHLKRVERAPGGCFLQKRRKSKRLFSFLTFNFLIKVVCNLNNTPDGTTFNQQDQVPTLKSTEVIGVIRGSEKPSIFVPANDPSSFQWFYVDVPAIARASGLPENTLYIEAINDNVDPSNPYPIPKDTNTLVRSSVMPQDHLNYTFTWYSLFDICSDTCFWVFWCDQLLRLII